MSTEELIIPDKINKGKSVLISDQPVDLVGAIKVALANKDVGPDKLASKIVDLLDAKTLNSKGDEMNDNKAQHAALELVLKLNGVKGLGKGTQIAIFNNIPTSDEKLQY